MRYETPRTTAGLLLLAGIVSCGVGGRTIADGSTAGVPSFSVYRDGKFSWPGDYSYGAKLDYRDKSGDPVGGHYDIKVTLTGPWGAWQPFATNWIFDTKPYTYLRFALKPTRADQKAKVYFMLVGDKPVGRAVDPFKYGPAPVAGQWAVYNIPLADIGVAKTTVYKFAIQDQTGIPNNVFYIDDVMFIANGG